MTKAMIQGMKPHRPSSGISLHEQSNFRPQDSLEDMYLEDLMNKGQKKTAQQTNIRATMGFWKLVWFDFKNSYKRWRVKNQELILFKKTIKSMESNFGSAIGSLFVFTRWLIVLNFSLAVMWICFVVFPVAIKFDYGRVTKEFALKNLLDGKGVVGESWLFYGCYTDTVGGYHVGLAYLFMLIITYFGSLFVLLGSIIKSSDSKSVSTVEKRYKFSLMLWTSWDHSITSSEAAINLSKGIASAFKDNLYEAKASLNVKQRTRRETSKVYSLRALAWLITIILIGGGCTAIVYLVLFMSFDSPISDEGTGESQDFLSVYGTTLAFSLINALVPSCIHLLPKLEQYESGRDELNVTLIRVFVLRMANLFALILTLYNTATTSVEGCAGTMIGQELYKLVIMDSLLHTVFQLTFKLSKHFWTRQKSEFNIPTAILVLIYRQALIWTGTLACPVMPLVGLLSILLFFCVNYTVITRTCKPPIKRWNQSRNTTFFTMFLLASLAMLIPPASIVMGSTNMINLGQTKDPNRFCGPFEAENPTKAYSRFYMDQAPAIQMILENLVSETVVMPLVLILFSVMVHQRSKIGIVKRQNLVLQAELQQEREENEKLIKQLQSMGIDVTIRH